MSESGTKTPALEVQGLGKSYGPLKALDEVSLAVAGGEFVGLLGPNGAGEDDALPDPERTLRRRRGIG